MILNRNVNFLKISCILAYKLDAVRCSIPFKIQASLLTESIGIGYNVVVGR